jgi:hypothetical protein
MQSSSLPAMYPLDMATDRSPLRHLCSGPGLTALVLLGLIFARSSSLAEPNPEQDESQRIKISVADCRSLVAHSPRPDVAYRPGVDVQGRPVAPADLTPTPEALSEDVVIELFIRLGTLAPSVNPALGQSETHVGLVRLDPRTGQAWLDDQELADPALAALASACAEALPRR